MLQEKNPDVNILMLFEHLFLVPTHKENTFILKHVEFDIIISIEIVLLWYVLIL